MKPTKVCVARQSPALPLMRLIPNVPFDRSKLPLTYRLDAKKIVGETAADIWKHAHTAGIVLEAVHAGIVLAEIFAIASVLAIAAPLLAARGRILRARLGLRAGR